MVVKPQAARVSKTFDVGDCVHARLYMGITTQALDFKMTDAEFGQQQRQTLHS